MLNKCANPDCSAVLRRLGDGRLFAFDLRVPGRRVAGSRPAGRSYQYHWLCNECCKTVTLSSRSGEVAIVPKEPVSPPSLRPEPVRDRGPFSLKPTASGF